MGWHKDPTVFMPLEESRQFFVDFDKWLEATGSSWKHFAIAVGISGGIRGSVVNNGNVLRRANAEAILAGMKQYPHGVAPPPRKPAPKGWERRKPAIFEPGEAIIPYEEIRRRRFEVHQERFARAMRHLSQEKPGMRGQRVWSMRPIWEMIA